MSYLILPSRRIVQPQQYAQIDYGNPITRGLVLAANNDCVVKNIAGTVTKKNTATKTRSKAGISPAYNGTNVDMRVSTSVLGSNPAQATLFAVVKIGQTSAESAILGCCNSASTNQLFRLEQRANGMSPQGFNLQFRDNSLNLLDIGNNTALTSGDEATLIGIFRTGTAEKALYINGLKVASSTVNQEWIALNRTDIGVLTQNAPSQWFNGGIPISAIFNRALTDSEIVALAQNPWQLFRTSSRRVWFNPSVSQGHTLTGNDATQGNQSDNGGITQNHDLTGSNVQQVNQGSSGSISQTHVLNGLVVSQANQSDSGSISQSHMLGGDNVAQSNHATSGDIGQSHVLTGGNADQNNTGSSGAVTQNHVLSGQNATQGNSSTSGGVAIDGTHILTGDNVAQANQSSDAGVGQSHILAGVNATQSANSGSGAIAQTHVLSGGAATQHNSSSTGPIILPGAAADYQLVSGSVTALVTLKTSAVAIGFRMKSTATALH